MGRVLAWRVLAWWVLTWWVLMGGLVGSVWAEPLSPLVVTVAAPEGWPGATATLTSAESADGIELPLRAGSQTLHVPGPAGTRYRLLVGEPAGWAQTEVEVGAPATLEIHPAAELRGVLSLPTGTPTPSHLDLRLAPAADEPASIRDRLSRNLGDREVGQRCAVASSGRFACWLPAALPLDLRLAAPGLAPHYLWGLDLDAEAPRGLGTLHLVAGSSLIGWVSGPVDPDGIRVVLDAAGSVRSTPSSAASRLLTTVTTRPNDHGFFQITGVPAGQYRLRAEHPDFTPAQVRDIAVREIGEYRVPDLTLRPPATVTVHLRSRLAPSGEPWRIFLGGLEGQGRFDAEPPAEDSSVYRLQRVPHGAYRLRVEDPKGGTLWDEAVDISDDTGLEVPLKLMEIVARVRYGGEPVRGGLWLGGPHHIPQVFGETGDDGEVVLTAPVQDVWRVEFRSADPRLHVTDKVPLRVSEDGIRAALDLRIPATTLTGTVRLDDGSIPPEVSLMLSSPGGAEPLDSTVTLDDGFYEVRGFPEGAVQLRAQFRRGQRHWEAVVQPISLADGETTRVDLELHERLQIRGELTGPDGQPIADAMLFGLPLTPFGDLYPAEISGVTDREGGVTLDVPPGFDHIRVVALAPGFQASSYLLSTEPTFRLRLDRGGGTLILHRPAGADLTLFADGMPLAWLFLRRWAAAHGQRPLDGVYRLPDFAPGTYSLCATRPPGDAPAPCTQGELAAGGVLELHFGDPPAG